MHFTDFHFLRPWWLLLLPLGIVAAWLLWRELRQGDAWRVVCDPELLPHLLVGPRGTHSALPFILLAVIWVLAVTALAGPSWNRLNQPFFRSLDTRVIVLDLSRSMDAPDVKPSRLERAKFKVADILERTEDGQVALVVFAGDAFIVSPVTQDVNTVANLLATLQTNMMPAQGSRADSGLRMAEQLLKQAGAAGGEILLVGDGVEGGTAELTAGRISDNGYRVSVIGVGSEDGAPIPLTDGGFLKDASGSIVVARTDFTTLQRVAERGGGRFARMRDDDEDLDIVMAAPLTPGEYEAVEDTYQAKQSWRDEGPWLVLLLLPLAALGFRRGWLLSITAVIALAPDASYALSWDDLWLRTEQQAARSLQNGDPARAAAVTADPAWRGSAYYRAQDYGAAADTFAKADDTTAHYNRGNSLAKHGDLEAALKAYDKALETDPGMDDAIHNREVVERALQSRQQGKHGQSTQRSQDHSGSADQDQSGQSPRPSNQDRAERSSQTPQQDPTPDPSQLTDSVADQGTGLESSERGEATVETAQSDDTNQDPQDAGSEAETLTQADSVSGSERQQAFEQWLRRIPDDPGGLLRRKFQRQYRRRGGEAKQTTQSW